MCKFDYFDFLFRIYTVDNSESPSSNLLHVLFCAVLSLVIILDFKHFYK